MGVVVANTDNPYAWEVEAGEFPWIWGQSGLHDFQASLGFSVSPSNIFILKIKKKEKRKKGGREEGRKACVL